jgi:amidohydrolase
MGGEDFGWFADVLPIALARLGTHGGGEPLDLHRGTFDVDERAIGVGVRLLARAALHALAAAPAAGPAPARTAAAAAGDTSPRHAVDERREPDDEFSGSDRPAG